MISAVSGFKAMFATALMVGVATCLAETGDATQEDFDVFETMRDTYSENCATCHGFDGIPMLAGVPNFSKGERMEKSDEELLVIMKDGKGLMPAWKDIFDGERQNQLLDYVRAMPGDQVFSARCLECHENRVPALSHQIPKTKTALLESKEDIEICTGNDIETVISRQELADVVTYLRILQK